MIMAHMHNQPMALAIDSCFISTAGTAPLSHSCDNYSSTGSSPSDVDDDGDDGNLVNQSVPFPWKLHEMLEIAEKENFANVVSWLPDHKSFKVYQTETFVRDIMPKYVSNHSLWLGPLSNKKLIQPILPFISMSLQFRQTKYKSFQRQCEFHQFYP